MHPVTGCVGGAGAGPDQARRYPGAQVQAFRLSDDYFSKFYAASPSLPTNQFGPCPLLVAAAPRVGVGVGAAVGVGGGPWQCQTI